MNSQRYVRTVVYLAISGIVLLYTTGVIAQPNGIAGFSGANGTTCTACHSQSGTVTVSLNAVSGTTVAPGSVANFELLVSGGPAVEAGLDIATSGGTLIATSAGRGIRRGRSKAPVDQAPARIRAVQKGR